jgi:molecular chaperone GrpE
MSDEHQKTAAANENREPEAPPATEAAVEPDPAGTEPDPVEALKAEAAELRDRLLRTAAEMENLRKRAEREARDAGQYAITQFARDLLGVGDNMRRAIDAVGADARSAADQAMIGLLDGIEMTERELLKTLARHGVRQIEPQGERFDPNLHQAMFEVPDSSVPSGTVVQVVQPGYTIGERCLRPAMVGVSKGGPKPGARSQPADARENAESSADKTA